MSDRVKLPPPPRQGFKMPPRSTSVSEPLVSAADGIATVAAPSLGKDGAPLLRRIAPVPQRQLLLALQRAIGNAAVQQRYLARVGRGTADPATDVPDERDPAFFRGQGGQDRGDGELAEAVGERRSGTGGQAGAAPSEGRQAGTPVEPPAHPVLADGSSGPEVVDLQRRLNGAGAEPLLEVDGRFGSRTAEGVRNFQRRRGLMVDGKVGNQTRRALGMPHLLGAPGAGAGTTVGAASPKKPLMYDTQAQLNEIDPRWPANGPGFSTLEGEKRIVEGLKTKKPAEITAYTIAGAGPGPAGKEEELALYHVLGKLGRRNRWGTEIDILAEIHPAPAGSPAGTRGAVGQITVRIDYAGKASADLIGRGAPGAPIGKKTGFGTAAKEVQDAFKVKAIFDGDAKWSVGDLNQVFGAFKRAADAGDADVLEGLVLIRIANVKTAEGGTIGGEYVDEVTMAPDGLSASRKRELKLADVTFNRNLVAFRGDKGDAAPASFHNILHEVGHAAEVKSHRDAEIAQFTARAEVNQKEKAGVEAKTKTKEERDKAAEALKAAKKTLTAKTEAMKAVSSTSVGTKRLERFVKVVNDNKIPRFTKYSEENWSKHPEEFFAEAYTLWLNDPTYLEENAKPLFTWFKTGQHRGP